MPVIHPTFSPSPRSLSTKSEYTYSTADSYKHIPSNHKPLQSSGYKHYTQPFACAKNIEHKLEFKHFLKKICQIVAVLLPIADLDLVGIWSDFVQRISNIQIPQSDTSTKSLHRQ